MAQESLRHASIRVRCHASAVATDATTTALPEATTVDTSAESLSLRLWEGSAHEHALGSLYSNFCVALAAGSLPLPSFRTYISQDAAYLGCFVKSYKAAIAITPSHDSESHRMLQELLHGAKEELQVRYAST